MKNLREKAIRGGFAKLCSQGASFTLRLGSLMILARLLDPRDFGLVGMVTAVTGIFHLFKDFGLSTATVQRSSVTEEQVSTLFWINVLVGVALGLLSVAVAPAIAAFYHEPRLVAVTAVLGAGFVFNAVGVQHSAILQRQMRFTTLAAIEIVSLLVSIAVGIIMAIRGYQYWALVATAITAPLVSSTCMWLATGWIPGRPRRHAGVRPLMRFGGALTLNGLVVYVASNFEKILLGRFWGASIVGIYGRAYQITNIPTDNLNSAVGGVAFSALSRVQDEPRRLKSYFLKSYSFVLGLTIPATIVCTLFARDVILVVLGPKWEEAIPIFRLLAPTILVFAIANPLSWLLTSLGLIKRLLKMGFVIAPIMIAAYITGMPYGAKGVAFAYSAVMVLWVLPLIAWAVHGTVISFQDILVTAARPLASGIVAGALAFGVRIAYGNLLSPFPRLVLESSVLCSTFLAILLFVAGQKSLYLDLLRGLKHSSAVVEDKSLVAAL